MSDWILVPSLVVLRGEFNTVAPGRRKGADGSIGDSHHSSSSDHTPDEDSDILRDHDADSKNEVHALDIDSAGPWPGGPAWFDRAVKAIVERHRTGRDNRLQYVIWNRQIANRAIDNWRWRTYTSTTDQHTNHAHFSSRYTTAQEQDTSPWGVAERMITDMELDELLWPAGKESDSWKNRFPGQVASVRNALAFSAYDSHDAEKLLNQLGAKLDAQGEQLARILAAGGADPDAAAADIARRINNG